MFACNTTRGTASDRPDLGVASLLKLGRSGDVTAFAPDTNSLRELDAGERKAWEKYSERLRDLTGEEYERAERVSWDELQSELRRIERRRRTLHRTAPP
jgi:hypothetical protein